MKTQYTVAHFAAIAAGVFATGADIANNLEWAIETSGQLVDTTNLIILAVGIGALATAAALGGVLKSARHVASKAVWFVALFSVWLVCSSFSMAISTDRLASQRDAKQSAAGLHAGAMEISAKLLDRAQTKADTYCIPLANVRPRSRDHYTTQCAKWTEEAAREAQILRGMGSNPAGPADSLGPRVQRVLEIATGVTIDASDVNLIVPLLAPLGLLLLGSILTGWGVAGERVEPEFDFAATGKAAEEAKAERYCQGYMAQNGKPPSAAEIVAALGCGHEKAKRIRRQYAPA